MGKTIFGDTLICDVGGFLDLTGINFDGPDNVRLNSEGNSLLIDGDCLLRTYNGLMVILGRGLGADAFVVINGPVADMTPFGIIAYGAGGSDRFFGNDERDLFFGDSGNDRMTGGGGRDTINGGAGGDRLNGGDGRDVLFGGDGADRLDGGPLLDSLAGGEGRDVFVLEDRPFPWEADRILDFTPGEDTISLSRKVYVELGVDGVGEREFVTAAQARTPYQHLIYNWNEGTLTYDADGRGADPGTAIGYLMPHLHLSNHDFILE